MGFWDAMAVLGCTHPAWLDEGPDDMGDRTCAVCEQRVRVALTEKALKVTANAMARQGRFSLPFPEVEE